ncbi:unnamed protein product, partial [Orchesella dallaii]
NLTVQFMSDQDTELSLPYVLFAEDIAVQYILLTSQWKYFYQYDRKRRKNKRKSNSTKHM